MQFTPGWRKVALAAHITSSVGWFGAVVAFLGLAIVGVQTASDLRAQSVYVAMESVGWLVIVPFSVASLITGLLQSAATHWGFVRHYWVVSKLLITIGASALLLLHMQVMSTVAQAAAAGTLTGSHLRDPRMQLVGDAAAATFVLIIAIGLSVFKPRGRTSLGEETMQGPAERTPIFYAFWAAMAVLIAAVVLRHLAGGIPHH
jgi:hypothetical protein